MGYFNREEFNIFTDDNMIKNDSYVREIRQQIKDKLLDINQCIVDEMNDMGLYHHKDKEHIVSLLTPCEFNHGKVNWLGIRYGKHPDTIDKLNFLAQKGETYGFQKHNCFQLDVCKTGLEMGIFHAVPNGSVDRMYCHQMIDNMDSVFINELKNAINGIVGYGFVWSIGVDGLSSDGFEGAEFNFDYMDGNVSDVGEEFIKWYSKYDCEGRFSSLLCSFSMMDERVESRSGIIDEFFKVVGRLKDVYDVMCWK